MKFQQCIKQAQLKKKYALSWFRGKVVLGFFFSEDSEWTSELRVGVVAVIQVAS